MSKLLVTGGAGFIGSNFIHYWRAQHPDDYIINLDLLTYAGHLENLSDLANDSHYEFVQGSICSYDLAYAIMHADRIDAVVNFAAETHVDRSLAGPDAERLFYETNLMGPLNLLRAAREAGVPRFHQISTDEVYGDLPLNRPDLKFHEGSPYSPNSPYAISKATADFAIRGFYRTHGFPGITISNCSNNYGANQTPEKVIPRSINLLQSGRKVKLYTDEDGIPGKNVRDWLHVLDHCSAIETILLNGRIGETYCVGGNSELSNYQLVEKMLTIMSEITGQEMTMETHVELVADRPGHDLRYAIDASKIERELGWRPRYTFESGFRETVSWYLSPEGRHWLEGVAETSREVRDGQDHTRQRRI